MDIKKLNEELSEFINEAEDDQEIQELKNLLQEDKEVKIVCDTEYSQGSWDHVDPTSYSLDDVEGRFEGYVYIEETDNGKWVYQLSGEILEEVYAGRDEDGGADYDYVSNGNDINETSKEFDTKQEAIDAFVSFLKEFGEICYIEEA